MHFIHLVLLLATLIPEYQARGAIDCGIARSRRLSIHEACRAIIERTYDMVAELISNAGDELEQDLSDHVLFAYGGNGGLFACGVAARAGLRDAYFLALGPVFSAFGSSVSDIAHVYERHCHLPLEDDADLTSLNRLVEETCATGARDLLGEGIKPDGAEYSLEMELSQAGGPNVNMKCPGLRFSGVEDLRHALGLDRRGVSLELVRLRMKKTIFKPALLPRTLQPEESGDALAGARAVAYGSGTGQASVYRWESLQPGNKVQGCAIRFYQALPVLLLQDVARLRDAFPAILNSTRSWFLCPALDKSEPALWSLGSSRSATMGMALPPCFFEGSHPAIATSVSSICGGPADSRPALLTSSADISPSADPKQVAAALQALRVAAAG